jgi:hypothetical protein
MESKSKKTLLVGIGLILIGAVAVCWDPVRDAFFAVVAGLLTLGVLLAGLLFVLMGYVQAKEDADTAAKDAAEASRKAAMAAKG